MDAIIRNVKNTFRSITETFGRVEQAENETSVLVEIPTAKLSISFDNGYLKNALNHCMPQGV